MEDQELTPVPSEDPSLQRFADIPFRGMSVDGDGNVVDPPPGPKRDRAIALTERGVDIGKGTQGLWKSWGLSAQTMCRRRLAIPTRTVDARQVTRPLRRGREGGRMGGAGVGEAAGHSHPYLSRPRTGRRLSHRGGRKVTCRPWRARGHVTARRYQGDGWEHAQEGGAVVAREQWTRVDDRGQDTLQPGRFVEATTRTPIGEVTVMGVCIPLAGFTDEVDQRRPRAQSVGRPPELHWRPGRDVGTRASGAVRPGLIAAQQCLPDDPRSFRGRLQLLRTPLGSALPRSEFGVVRGGLPLAEPSLVYESVKPSTGTGRLLWHTLGANTIDLIYRHVHVDTVRDELETPCSTPRSWTRCSARPTPTKGRRRSRSRLPTVCANTCTTPAAAPERLEELRHKHEQGLLVSIESLK